MKRREFVQVAAATAVGSLIGRACAFAEGQNNGDIEIHLRPHAIKGPLPHTWEECVGSDRAVVGLRKQWLEDLSRVKQETGMKSVRFHGLFNDEMGVWPSGAKAPNFLYVDMVFDAMLAAGVKPLVELSFMPAALASSMTRTVFFYHGNASPPTDMNRWGELITALATHCVERYGIDQVKTWNFEVWNEPNIFFWSGTKDQYFELDRQSAVALKGVDSRLRVGGPATAIAAWVGDLIQYCSSQKIPLDFVSTHIYADDRQKDVFGEDRHYTYEEVIPKAIQKVKDEIKASAMPDFPLYLTEWASQNPAFIAHTIKGTIGLVDILSFWTFDNVFEENGVPTGFINNAFGLIGTRGVPRPAYYAFTLLHRLGNTQLDAGDGPVLATRREDGSLAILLWNLIPVPKGQHSSTGDPLTQVLVKDATDGKPMKFVLTLERGNKPLKGSLTRVDQENGNFHKAYEAMGRPQYPTTSQIEQMKRASALPKPESISLTTQKEFVIMVPPNGLALLELS